MNSYSVQLASRYQHVSLIGLPLLLLTLIGVCIYGGFFNAGLGIILLSYLALAGYTNIHAYPVNTGHLDLAEFGIAHAKPSGHPGTALGGARMPSHWGKA